MTKKTQLEMEGTIRSLTIIETEKQDQKIEMGKITVMNTTGDKIKFQGPTRILEGYKPGEQVIATLSRANKTIKEATSE